MALEIYDLGSTISILNDGEYTIITKQDASIELNGPYVALIDFTGQRYEYNFADITVPSEVSGQALAETLNTYLQSSGGGGGGGDTVTGRDVTTLSATSKKVNDFTSAQVITNAADTYSLTLAITTSTNHYLYVITASRNPFVNVTITSYASPKDGAILVIKLARGGSGNLNIPGYSAGSGFNAGVWMARYSTSASDWLPVNYSPIDAVVDFTDLADVPSSFTGQANKPLVVNAAATGLEFGQPVYNVRLPLTASQIKTLNSVPIDIGIPSSGSGFFYRVTAFDVKVTFVSVQFTSTLLNIGVASTNAAQREFNQLAVAYNLFKPSTEGINLISSQAENSTISVWADANSAVGDSTIVCYITVVRVAI